MQVIDLGQKWVKKIGIVSFDSKMKAKTFSQIKQTDYYKKF